MGVSKEIISQPHPINFPSFWEEEGGGLLKGGLMPLVLQGRYNVQQLLTGLRGQAKAFYLCLQSGNRTIAAKVPVDTRRRRGSNKIVRAGINGTELLLKLRYTLQIILLVIGFGEVKIANGDNLGKDTGF